MPLQKTLKKLAAKENLTSGESREAFDLIFTGEMPREQIASFLLGLRNKGETTDEILGAVLSMRSNMLTIKAPPDAIDIVGTGGDGHGTLNVSTAAALVVSACGVPVAKHGNRAASSLSGSSDTLAALGVNLEPEWEILEQCLQLIGIAFLYAPRHHPAMRHVAEVRRELGVRTIFNLLGPLTNPAGVKHHMIGVYDPKWLLPMAKVLVELDSERAWLVHGEGIGRDGMDEISICGPTAVVETAGKSIDNFTVTPEQVGLPRATLGDIRGGSAAENAAAIRRLLGGKRGPYRDIVTLNAAAALIVAGKAESLIQGMRIAGEAIDSGRARQKLNDLVRVTNYKAG